LTIDFADTVQLKGYINAINDKSKPLRHENFTDSVIHAKELAVHIFGDNPTDLLESYRPNEPKEIHAYRQKIFVPITKSKSKKVVNVLSRIKNSSNFSLNFPKNISAKIKEGEDLQTYTEQKYPFHKNLIQWLFDIVLKQMLADPNSVIAFAPVNLNVSDTEFVKPFGFIYQSRQVIDFRLDNYYTFWIADDIPIKTRAAIEKKGNLYHIYTPNEIIEAKQIALNETGKAVFEIKTHYTHNIGEIPVFHLRGEFVENTFPFLYESFMAGVLPYWNDALREFSDKQATFVQHVYLERVEMQVECDNLDCNAGIVVVKRGDQEIRRNCSRCKGTGFISGRSPYGVTVVKEDKMEKETIQFPGVEYINKPTEIVELLKDDIYKH